MGISFYIGIVGSLILLTGAVLPSRNVSHPVCLPKNWFFVFGNASMFVYSVLNYMAGGSVFFIFLQVLIAVSTLLMMLNTPDKLDIPILSIAGLALIIGSLRLFEGYSTIIFVIGLVILGLGFAMNTGTIRRDGFLASGSAIIAFFSYMTSDWVFFWLNIFFCVFSIFYVVKHKKSLSDNNSSHHATHF